MSINVFCKVFVGVLVDSVILFNDMNRLFQMTDDEKKNYIGL